MQAATSSITSIIPANPCSTPQRVLPADVFDYLEFGALAFGGIGAGRWAEGPDDIPYCARGFDDSFGLGPRHESEVLRALSKVGIFTATNDDAVRAINKRRGTTNLNDRVPFDLWAKELNVVRGDA